MRPPHKEVRRSPAGFDSRHRAHQQAPYGGSSGRRPSKRQPSPPQLPRRYSGPEADVELMYGSEGSAASDYDLEAFGPVDVDPTLTESEWLRSQGIDPDALDEGEGEAAPVAVLSLAEVSYSRDIDSVNKAEREQHIKAANALWGAQALAATDRRSRAATRANPPPPPHPTAADIDAQRASEPPLSAAIRGGGRRANTARGRGRGGRGPPPGRGRGPPPGPRSGPHIPPPHAPFAPAGGPLHAPLYGPPPHMGGGGGAHLPPRAVSPPAAAVLPRAAAAPPQQQQAVAPRPVAPPLLSQQQLQQQALLQQQQQLQQLQQQQLQQQRAAVAASNAAAAAAAARADASLRANARTFVPLTVSVDGMNPHAPAFVPGFGFKT